LHFAASEFNSPVFGKFYVILRENRIDRGKVTLQYLGNLVYQTNDCEVRLRRGIALRYILKRVVHTDETAGSQLLAIDGEPLFRRVVGEMQQYKCPVTHCVEPTLRDLHI